MKGSEFARVLSRLSPLVLLMCALLIVVVSARDAPARRPVGEPFTLAVGESEAVGNHGLEVGFFDILYDGRCPEDRMCYVPGNVIARVWADDPIRYFAGYNLHTSRGQMKVAIYGDYHIRLVDVTPRPRTDRAIDPSEYVITVVVEIDHFVGCGMLVPSDDCLLYRDDLGGNFMLDNYGNYGVGAKVRVIGMTNPDYVAFCRYTDGWIVNNWIESCGTTPVHESTWGRVKALYQNGPE